ncbi:MAG: response regulator [Lysobacter sp.]|nr:response regulator [Lysobacter sp.]
MSNAQLLRPRSHGISTAVVLGVFAGFGALVTLLGWALEIRRLTDWFGLGISMLPMAGLAALLAGTALVALGLGHRRMATGFAAPVLLIGAAVLFEHVTGIDLHIDRLVLYREWGQNATYAPGRIGVPASVSFTVLGATLLLAAQRRNGARSTVLGGVLVSAIAMLSIVGYLFLADTLYSLPRLTTIALQTAIIVLALGMGIIASARNGVLVFLREETAAATLVRRTLPSIILLPVLLGWLMLRAQKLGWFDPAFGTSVLVLGLIGLLTIVLWRTAASVASHERSLLNSQQRLEGVLATIGDGFQVVDRDWRYTYFNLAFRRDFAERGVDADAMLGRTISEVFPGFEATPAGHTLQRVMSERTEMAYETWFEPWQRWFAFRAAPTPDGGLSILSQDITERRQAAERLRASEERLQLAMLIADAATWDADLVNKTVHWSDSHFTMLGYPPTPDRQATHAMWQDMVLPEDMPNLQREWTRAEVGHDMFVSEHRMRHALTGDILWVNAAGRFFYDADGESVRFVGVMFDITARKHSEEQLNRLTTDLRDADRSKNEFLASLAHELRNPLAPMRTALEVMKRADGREDLMTESRATMERQLGQMTRLIDDLLDINRITRSKLELRMEQVDLASVVNHAVEAIRPLADGADVRLHIRLPDDPIHLHADPARLAQIFSNLLNNACKYNDRGGNVWLTAVRQGAEVLVTVRDDGSGIAPAMLPRVFDMFFQVGNTLERSHGGLGIGLALVHRLVAMHGGSVAVQSEGEGKGSEFLLRLPVLDESAVSPPDAPQDPRVAAGRRRILVVDDNVDTARSLAMLLGVMGNETAIGHDGDAAVTLAGAFKPDVIFLDIGLPGRNGYEACRAIRQLPGGTDITIVAITGWGQERDRLTSSEAGFDTHLVKPVDIPALVAVLESNK